MLHACNAIDGTAAKVYPVERSSNLRFTNLLRRHDDILGATGAPGIDLQTTRFPVKLTNPKADPRSMMPDIADVIYGVHRCTHGHGDELPAGFELLEDAAGPPGLTRITIENGTIQLSDRVIFGLLFVAVLEPANSGQRVPDSYFLFYGRGHKLVINAWWGRAADFRQLLAENPLPKVTMDFTDWMTPLQQPRPRRAPS